MDSPPLYSPGALPGWQPPSEIHLRMRKMQMLIDALGKRTSRKLLLFFWGGGSSWDNFFVFSLLLSQCFEPIISHKARNSKKMACVLCVFLFLFRISLAGIAVWKLGGGQVQFRIVWLQRSSRSAGSSWDTQYSWQQTLSNIFSEFLGA